VAGGGSSRGALDRRRGLGGSGTAVAASGGGLLAVIAIAHDNLNGLPRARVVAIDVLGDVVGGGRVAAGVVGDLDALVDGVKGSLGEVGETAGPLDGALGSGAAAGAPGADLDLHGGLGEAGAALGLLVLDGADDGAVNDPLDALGGPVDGVGVVHLGGRLDVVEAAAVVGGGVTLAEVVGLDLVVLATEPLPVDLVEVSGLEDDAGDDADTGGGLQLDVETAEEDALVAGDGGGVGLGLDAEDGALVVVVEGGAGQLLDDVAGTGAEVALASLVTESLLSGAGWKKESQLELWDDVRTEEGGVHILSSRGLQSVKVCAVARRAARRAMAAEERTLEYILAASCLDGLWWKG
jgi:hypothetical protein